MKNIIVCDAIHHIGLKLLKQEEDVNLIDASDMQKSQMFENLQIADVAITRSPTAVDSEFLANAPKLKALVRAGVGVDNIDLDACSKQGIIVMNVPTANTIAAVEMSMCHILNCARKFINSSNDLKINKIWKREKWYGTELFGKSLGIIGFGNIGSRVGIRAMAFGMKVIAYDPYIDAAKITNTGALRAQKLEDLFSCDFLSIHTPKTPETINMINDAEIEKLKDGVKLINCARGGLFNEEALFRGLKSGKIGALGLDVFDKEPATNSPLMEFENVSVTPHLGANTLESQKNIATMAVDAALQAARSISYPNALNLPIKIEDLPDDTLPFIELVSKMSYLAAQIDKTQIKAIHIQACGEMEKYANSMLTFALVGALKDSLGESINYVNAKFIAQDRGIQMSASSAKSSTYKNKITVQITSSVAKTQISGVIFSQTQQRIVEINNFKTDFKPKGKMIILKNVDVAGFIMKVSTILAAENINIADFRLGRDDSGHALAVVLVDEAIDKEILEKLNAIDSCVWAKYAVI